MTLNDDERAALQGGAVRIGVFFRLATDPVVRLWLGIGDIAPGVNALDATGALYHGLGEIAGVPAFNQLVNGTAARVEFRASGVSGELLEIASGGDAEQVQGKAVSVGLALMGASWQLLGAIKWCANYTADRLSIEQAVNDDPKAPPVRSVALSCGSLLTSRRRPGLSYFSDQDQQVRHPGDRFCERTPVYANGFSKTWPTFPS